jgi:hypothetical protein
MAAYLGANLGARAYLISVCLRFESGPVRSSADQRRAEPDRASDLRKRSLGQLVVSTRSLGGSLSVARVDLIGRVGLRCRATRGGRRRLRVMSIQR